MSAALSFEPDEPQGSGLPGEQDADGWDGDGVQQGLYVTLPAEELTLEGFAEDGRADTMAPGPLLAMVLGAVAGEDGEGLTGLSDDQLIGFLSGTRRMESRMAWAKMAALAELASRPRRQDFAADEVAAAFNVTWLSAAGEIDYARTVKRRLPVTFAALGTGKLHPVHVKIIEEVTGILSDEDAAIADSELAEAAQSKTYGELRRAATRLVLKLDPEAVRRRKENARGQARVRSFREESGNAGITGREMPSVEVLASMQHVEDRARALRDAGVPGTWEELKVRATLDLLQERDSRPAADAGPAVGANVTITVPHTAMDADFGPPGEVAGFGIIDHADTRDLIAAAAGHPATRWCVTLLNPDGTAAAHGCGAGRRRWPPGQGPPGSMPLRGPAGLLEHQGIHPGCATAGARRAAPPAVTSAIRAASGTARRSGYDRHRVARRRLRGGGRAGERGPGDPLRDGGRGLRRGRVRGGGVLLSHLRPGPGARPGWHGGPAAAAERGRTDPRGLPRAAARGAE